MFTSTPSKTNNNNKVARRELFRDQKRMKIRCDVCDKVEASVFCSADEAALCDACDCEVHRANKLASKHLRYSLLHPSSKQSPLCDICQERRAFLFCQEDRAILCRECDLPIHKASEHTKKHNRFLLTGIMLSTCSSSYPSSSSSNNSSTNMNTNNRKSLQQQQTYLHNNPSFSNEISSDSPSVERESPSIACNFDDSNVSDNISVSTSSISEYLETLPGWRVDDFLDPSVVTDGFYKTFDNLSPLEVDQDLESNMSYSFSAEDSALWVPQVSAESPQQQPPVYILDTHTASSGFLDGQKESKEAKGHRKINGKLWKRMNAFAVPE